MKRTRPGLGRRAPRGPEATGRPKPVGGSAGEGVSLTSPPPWNAASRRIGVAAGRAGTESELDAEDVEHFALFVGRCQSFLDELARHHLYPRTTILGSD